MIYFGAKELIPEKDYLIVDDGIIIIKEDNLLHLQYIAGYEIKLIKGLEYQTVQISYMNFTIKNMKPFLILNKSNGFCDNQKMADINKLEDYRQNDKFNKEFEEHLIG